MLNTAQQLLHAWLAGGGPAPHQYKAPHAYRGTPPRLRFSRYSRGRRPLFHI